MEHAEFYRNMLDNTYEAEFLMHKDGHRVPVGIRSVAIMDPLTNIPNRRYIDHFLVSKFNEYRTFDISFGVLFVDIDHFKNVNDTYGHDIGDEILTMLAQSCSGMLRSTDLFGRYGGEEFLAVLTGIDEGDMKRIAESMRMIIENSALRKNNMDLHITISIGSTLANSEDSIESIVKRADSLLYRSKESGRNRVTFG